MPSCVSTPVGWRTIPPYRDAWGSSVTTPMQAEIDDARRELENAYREYERATQDLSSLPPIATHERAALTQRKVEAWNSLEAARIRYEDVQKRATASK
jgi:hypothetical protein